MKTLSMKRLAATYLPFVYRIFSMIGVISLFTSLPLVVVAILLLLIWRIDILPLVLLLFVAFFLAMLVTNTLDKFMKG